MHGTDLDRTSFTGASMGTQPLSNLRLEKGGLVAERQLFISGTTPSFTACSSTTTGQARSCGFVSKGAGSCEPGTAVTLGGGACGTGTCSGDAMLRVCSGTQPCEYGSAGMLVSGDDACSTLCPQVAFTCPAAGKYNVMAGPYNTSQSWSVSVVPSSGLLGYETLRGAQLVGAKLQGQKGGSPVTLIVVDVINASTVPISEAPGTWDPSGDTWLYRLQARSPVGGTLQEVCGTTNSTQYAVPVSGLFGETDGMRTESSTEFTFSCDTGVVSKCYRWGYQPWKDAPNETRMRNGHWACTRMARADYCGNGQSKTLPGTLIVPWDNLNPQVIQAVPPPPGSPAEDMEFEAGWWIGGAKCLSHWRWQQQQVSCLQLTPPIYDGIGNITNRCSPGSKQTPTGQPCASICDSPEEAQGVFWVRQFNKSFTNSLP
jgi:hypothetical protein